MFPLCAATEGFPMPIDPRLQRLIDAKLEHARAPQWELPIEEVRAAFAAFWTPAVTGEPVGVAAVEDRAVPTRSGSVPARVYRPVAGDEPLPLLVYFHGGGYVKGGIVESDAFCRRLARTARQVVVSVGYRLAPEHPFPAALDDAWDATAWAFAHAGELGATARSFAVSGESAGGNLAAVVCLLARSSGEVRIARQVLLQPVVDFTLGFPSIGMPKTECLVPRGDLAWYYREYQGPRGDPRDPRVSPLWAEDLAGLPPALVIAAEFDTLRDEAAACAEKLRAAGVTVAYSCYPGMIYGFLQMAGLVEAAQRAIDEVATFLRD
jgi:acetyl esterase